MPFSNEEYVEEKKSNLNFYVLSSAVVIFISSLFTNCFCTMQGCRTSIEALLLGWLTMLTGGASLSWLANPLLFISWILLMKNKKYNLLFSFLASIMCLSFLMFTSIIDNEAGTINPIIKIGIGYWLWVCSCTITFSGGLLIRFIQTKK